MRLHSWCNNLGNHNQDPPTQPLRQRPMLSQPLLEQQQQQQQLTPTPPSKLSSTTSGSSSASSSSLISY